VSENMSRLLTGLTMWTLFSSCWGKENTGRWVCGIGQAPACQSHTSSSRTLYMSTAIVVNIWSNHVCKSFQSTHN